jgi:hypothetical protein
MLQVAVEAGKMVVGAALNRDVRDAAYNAFSALGAVFSNAIYGIDLFKDHKIFLDEEQFKQICAAIDIFKPQTDNETPAVGQYTLRNIIQKINPISLNNRFILKPSTDTEKLPPAYSLVSYILQSTRLFLERDDTTPNERGRYVLQMDVVLNEMVPGEVDTILLTQYDRNNLEQIRHLRGDKNLFNHLNSKSKDWTLADSTKIDKEFRILNYSRFCHVLSSLDGLDYNGEARPIVPGDHLSSMTRPFLVDYLQNIHPDTINNKHPLQFSNGQKYCVTLLTGFLYLFYEFLKSGDKSQVQAKNIHALLNQIISILKNNGVNISDIDRRYVIGINTIFSKYTGLSSPLQVSLESGVPKKDSSASQSMTDSTGLADLLSRSLISTSEAHHLANASSSAAPSALSMGRDDSDDERKDDDGAATSTTATISGAAAAADKAMKSQATTGKTAEKKKKGGGGGRGADD